MTVAPSLRERGIDPVPLFLAYIACADRQLHMHETRRIDAALSSHAEGPTRAAVEAILNAKDDSPSVDEVVGAITADQQRAALEQALALACADGVKALEELSLLDKVAKDWGFSAGEVKSLWEAARAESIGLEEAPSHLEVANLVVLALDATLGRSFLDEVAAAGIAGWTAMLARHRQGSLLGGPEYTRAVERCAQVAEADFAVVEPLLSDCVRTLESLDKNLSSAPSRRRENGGLRQNALEAERALAGIRKEVATRLQPRLQAVHNSLHAKHRALHRLTVAFMGKTKSGKSTLHAVVTGSGWNAIGIGAQRTTRYNRVYDWRNLRIIDTPGIGAPDAGGRTDEEIAESIVDEADIICFIVTNDSQQLSEFAFLKKLRAKAKPLLILLNVQKAFDPDKEEQVERFLRNHERLFQRKGENDLLGHEDHIRKFAKSNYGHDFFDIVPVHLHAARLARDGTTARARELWEASRMDCFLNALQSAVLREGPIRRSQTLIGSTSCDVGEGVTALRAILGQCDTMQRQWEQARLAALGDIARARDDAERSLANGIRGVFSVARAEVPRFAEEHWKDSSKRLNQAWAGVLDRLEFEHRLRRAVEGASLEFERQVRDALDEIGRELRILGELHRTDAALSGNKDRFSYKSLVAIGGAIVASVGAGLTFFAVVSNPVGWAVGGAGFVIALFSRRLESTSEKMRKASRKIAESLRDQLANKERELLAQQEHLLSEQIAAVRDEVAGYFEGLVSGVAKTRELCATAERQLSHNRELLDRAFASRVLDWLAGGELSDGFRIVAVEREPGRRLLIRTADRFNHNHNPEYVCRVLQEELVLES